MRVVMLGPPGVGKGTQARLLSQKLGVPHIASGDLFRRHQREGTPLGLKATEYINQGLLVPDEITIAMMLDEVLSLDSYRGFLLDGFPRNLHQAHSLEEALAYRSMKVDWAILIEVEEEELLSRMGKRRVCPQCHAVYHTQAMLPKEAGVCDRCGAPLEQRVDDQASAMKRRLEIYRQESMPLIGLYERSGNLVKINGVGTVDEVHRRVEEALGVPKGRGSS